VPRRRSTPGDSRHAENSAHLVSRAVDLLQAYERTGDIKALNSGVTLMEQVVAATPENGPEYLNNLSTLAGGYYYLAGRTADTAVLSRAIRIGRKAATAAPQGHRVRPAILNNLGTGLLSLYDRTGQSDLLDEALHYAREAVAATPPGHRLRAAHLNNLGTVLQARYEHSGDSGCLAEAILAGRQAVDSAPPGHPEHAKSLCNLSSSLQILFERRKSPDTLSEAIEVGRRAVAAAPPGHLGRAAILNCLGTGLQCRFDLTGDLASLRQAIDIGRAAVAAGPVATPSHAMFQSNLGAALRTLYEHNGDLKVLTEAVDRGRASVSGTPPDDPDAARHAYNLGTTLRTLYQCTGEHAALHAARDAFAAAADTLAAPTTHRVNAGRWRAAMELLDQSPEQALRSCEEALELLPRIAPRHLVRHDRQSRLGEIYGLSRTAAASALAARRPDRAVELLEHARGVVLGEDMDARGAVSRLRAQAPELAAQFDRLRISLDSEVADNRRLLAGQWEELMRHIRAQPGLDQFLRPPLISRIQRQAEYGPIVYINVHAHRCDALVLTTDPAEPVRVIPLPGLTVENSDAYANTLLTARDVAQDPNARFSERQSGNRRVLEVLAWVWDTTAGPVLDALGICGPPPDTLDWPRLWWCPTGAMAYLPLHAAGHHDEASTESPSTVMDRVVSSYTSTARALEYARRRLAEDGASIRTLIVAMPETPNASPLDYVSQEAEALETLLDAPKLLSGPQATFEAVTTALPDFAVVHLACHGQSDWQEPASSKLLLHDHQTKPLTVNRIADLDLDRARLAFLSACNTTDTAPRLSDESVHITSAFQLAGYPHVIGTLWPISDEKAPVVTRDIYAHLTANGTTPPHPENSAAALHGAIRRLRDQHPSNPTMWSAYVHVGC
jgi:tetratricopeptide (TPR) repeat protein